MCTSQWTHGLQHARLPCPSPTPEACSNSCPLSHDAVQPSHPLSSHSPPSFNFSSIMVFSMSQFFKSGGQSIRASASASVLPINIQGWFPLGLTGWISLLSKELSRVPTLQFKSINTLALSFLYGLTLTSIPDNWKNHSFNYMDFYWPSVVSDF